jgi:glyoxylase I family protein
MRSHHPPFALEGIDHLLLLVRGMSEALAFYCDVLGCRVECELPEFGMVQLRAGSAMNETFAAIWPLMMSK